MTQVPDPSDLAEQTLIACPSCDALHRVEVPRAGERAVCRRCHTVLIAPRTGAFRSIVLLAVTILILMIGATFLPFLQLRIAGVTNSSSIFDAALAFVDGPLVALAFATAALIVLIPVMRVMLLVYVLAPLALHRAPLPQAAAAFRLADALKPWSMAEIFAIGCAVALVKVADLAQVEFGPAFWMFAGLVVVTTFQDGLMDRWSVWHALEEAGAR
jgi:paraquat-inducible protein A